MLINVQFQHWYTDHSSRQNQAFCSSYCSSAFILPSMQEYSWGFLHLPTCSWMWILCSVFLCYSLANLITPPIPERKHKQNFRWMFMNLLTESKPAPPTPLLTVISTVSRRRKTAIRNEGRRQNRSPIHAKILTRFYNGTISTYNPNPETRVAAGWGWWGRTHARTHCTALKF